MTTQPAIEVDPLEPGLHVGRYELIKRLAVGGMAEIYLARATGIEGFEKLVVLKRILPQFASSKNFVSMFLDEARLSATLQHPNIAQVHDIGQWQGSYFFTMEYVRGEDVRCILKAAVLTQQRIPISHTITIIIGAAAGLHAAHEKRNLDGTPLNVVHRDVSPSNVLVSYDGAVKLVDFGVAKAALRQTETLAGTLKGKLSYMSPEQCRAKTVDRRSDIFSLGILLYELTTRRRLFGGASEFEIMNKIVKEEIPRPSAGFKNYPPELEAVVMKALQRDPDDRYATAQEMQLALEDFARLHRLSVSSVKLGQFMRKMFIDRMRANDEAVANRPRTEEYSSDGDDFIEIEIESDCDIATADTKARPISDDELPDNVRTEGSPPPLPTRVGSAFARLRSESGPIGKQIHGRIDTTMPLADEDSAPRRPLLRVVSTSDEAAARNLGIPVPVSVSSSQRDTAPVAARSNMALGSQTLRPMPPSAAQYARSRSVDGQYDLQSLLDCAREGARRQRSDYPAEMAAWAVNLPAAIPFRRWPLTAAVLISAIAGAIVVIYLEGGDAERDLKNTTSAELPSAPAPSLQPGTPGTAKSVAETSINPSEFNSATSSSPMPSAAEEASMIVMPSWLLDGNDDGDPETQGNPNAADSPSNAPVLKKNIANATRKVPTKQNAKRKSTRLVSKSRQNRRQVKSIPPTRKQQPPKSTNKRQPAKRGKPKPASRRWELDSPMPPSRKK